MCAVKKLLLYGGAFDPPHRGHERLLWAAIEAVRPDLAVVAPTAVAPHKDRAVTPFFDRMMMARVFLGCGGSVRISGMENTGGGRRKSYTINTVKRLKKRYPGAEIYLLIGGDMLVSFDGWHLWRRLLSMVTLVAAGRREGDRAAMLAARDRIERLRGRIKLLDIEPLEMCSAEIRENCGALGGAAGMSDTVAAYAEERGLYR